MPAIGQPHQVPHGRARLAAFEIDHEHGLAVVQEVAELEIAVRGHARQPRHALGVTHDRADEVLIPGPEVGARPLQVPVDLLQVRAAVNAAWWRAVVDGGGELTDAAKDAALRCGRVHRSVQRLARHRGDDDRSQVRAGGHQPWRGRAQLRGPGAVGRHFSVVESGAGVRLHEPGSAAFAVGPPYPARLPRPRDVHPVGDPPHRALGELPQPLLGPVVTARCWDQSESVTGRVMCDGVAGLLEVHPERAAGPVGVQTGTAVGHHRRRQRIEPVPAHRVAHGGLPHLWHALPPPDLEEDADPSAPVGAAVVDCEDHLDVIRGDDHACLLAGLPDRGGHDVLVRAVQVAGGQVPEPRGVHRPGPPGQQNLAIRTVVSAQDQVNVDRLGVPFSRAHRASSGLRASSIENTASSRSTPLRAWSFSSWRASASNSAWRSAKSSGRAKLVLRR